MPVSRKRRGSNGRPVSYSSPGETRQNRIFQLTAAGEKYLNQGIEHVKRSLSRGEVDELSEFVIITLGRLSQSSQEIVLLFDEVNERRSER